MTDYVDYNAIAKGVTGVQQNATGTPRAIGNRVLVTDLDFGDQITEGGIIIQSDDGKTRGIYPRWGKVYSKGPKNKDEYNVGQWILIEHGRWTRGFKCDTGTEVLDLRMVESESVLGYADEKPNDLRIGAEYGGQDGPDTVNPQDFVDQARG